MWGSDVFGDFDEPKLINLATLMRGPETEDIIKVKKVCVGGSFSLIQDLKLNVYCWGSEYFKEVKVNKESKRMHKIPKKILDGEDKIKDIAAGGYYAICHQKYRKLEETAGLKTKSRAMKKYEAAAKFDGTRYSEKKSEPPISESKQDHKEKALEDLQDSPEPTRLAYEQSFGSSPHQRAQDPPNATSAAAQAVLSNITTLQELSTDRAQQELQAKRALQEELLKSNLKKQVKQKQKQLQKKSKSLPKTINNNI